MLSQVKLIAEPWDLGEGGYQVGGFPPGWSDWNGRYRDAVRSYWKGDGGLVGELASRLSGSSDIFEPGGRGPTASINFITAHDGFTLRDLVSYNDKHNEANGEDNRDGESHNRSWNCGVEGPTDDPGIRALRLRQMRNFLATLFFSQGVPDAAARRRDSVARSGATTTPIARTTRCRGCTGIWTRRRPESAAPALHAARDRAAQPASAVPAPHVLPRARGARLRREGHRLAASRRPGDDATRNGIRDFARCLGAHLSGRGLSERDELGKPVEDDDLLLLLNAHDEEIAFRLGTASGEPWHVRVDTDSERAAAQDVYASGVRSIRCADARSYCCAGRAYRDEARARDAVRRSAGGRTACASGCGRRRARRVELEIDGAASPRRCRCCADGGWYEHVTRAGRPGTRYRYRIDGELAVPDPASRFNPDDVHGASEVVDPRAFEWTDGDWRGGRGTKRSIYELHVGTFSPAGTFRGVRGSGSTTSSISASRRSS